ncbi:MAG TPA: condensation domain-containing protein, partial [Ktedonobacteraceae bacterium]
MITEQTSVFPLSFEQQRLWFFHQLEPQLPLYNVPLVHQLNGELDSVALEQSLNDVVRRHETLRTTFEMLDEQPVQVVHPELLIELPVVDLRMLSLPEREKAIARWIEKEALYSFDLANGPLLRAQLLHSREEEYIFLLTMHHIVFDDSSVDILFHDLQACYNARREGRLALLSELPIQYADYAVWQREWQDQVSDAQLPYWKQQMKDAPAVLELPADRPRPPVQTYQGDLYFFSLPPELAQAINDLSKQEGMTLFMTLLAAFQLLLARYTAQHDIIVGSPMINRNRVEIESVIGFFVNMLALRTDLTGNPTFRQLLKRVRKVVLDAYAHLDVPFEKLVDELQIQRDPSYTPLFQVMFALQNASTTTLQLSGMNSILFEKTSKTARFDLSLIMMTGNGLSGVVEYNTDLFEKATIVRLIEHFQTILAGIVAYPDLPLFHLPLITTKEREQLLFEGNTTARDYPSEKSFCQL